VSSIIFKSEPLEYIRTGATLEETWILQHIFYRTW